MTPLRILRRLDAKQQVRLRRFVLASGFSMAYVGVLAVFGEAGAVDRTTVLQVLAIVVLSILAFLVVFLSGLNLRAPDPSLTTVQITAAMCTMLFVFHRAPETRLMFGAFFFVALTFGMLRTGGVKLTVLGALSLAGYAAVALLRYRLEGRGDVLRIDMLELITLAVVLPWFVFIGSLARRLKAAERRKDEFLTTLAHELRNPLAPVRNGVQILRLDPARSSNGSLLPMMERQIAQITRLLDDLLDIGRIARGKIDLSRTSVDVQRCVADATEATAPLFAEMGHRLVASLPEQPLMLDADSLRVKQILVNLLTNAAKYTPPGGRVDVEAARAGGSVEIRVRDTGVGIPRERLASVFDLYSQVESQAVRQRGGLGIGLAVVRELVRLHQGTIEVRSEGEGRGSEFVVRLPAPRDDLAGSGGSRGERGESARGGGAAVGAGEPTETTR